MDVEFNDEDLDRLEIEERFTGGWQPSIVRAFRKRMQSIRAARNERDLYFPGNRMEKLQGRRSHQHSMRLNNQYRLIVEIRSESEVKRIVVMGIEDYH